MILDKQNEGIKITSEEIDNDPGEFFEVIIKKVKPKKDKKKNKKLLKINGCGDYDD